MRLTRMVPCLMAVCAALLGGCSNKAIFSTNTSVGIDLDAKAGTTSIAYSRQEGYIGPIYENGEAPPVVASLKSDGKIFSPRVSQVYATGNAAVIATSREHSAAADAAEPMQDLSGKKKVMFFGTSTTTGFKLGFAPATFVPDELVFGFKRQELSYIPLIEREDGESPVYSSTLAFYETNRKADPNGTSLPNLGFSDMSYFSTGKAAEQLAASDIIGNFFRREALEQFLARYDETVDKERYIGQSIMRCYKQAPFSRLPSAWEDGIRTGVIEDTKFKAWADRKYADASAVAGKTDDERKAMLFNVDGKKGPSGRYEMFIMNTAGTDDRLELLVKHADFVCDTI